MQRPGRGILESLAERLGVEEATDGAPEPEQAEQPPAAAPEELPDVVQPKSAGQEPESSETKIAVHPSIDSFRFSAPASSTLIDERILASRGKQALYVRLPPEMHEYLEDLSHALSKASRDASMTNLVAQAILDKYPDAMEPGDKGQGAS